MRMTRSLKLFARRIVLVHVALLVCVLAVVAGASHAVYRSAHDQAITQSRKQLELLANQTGSGLRGYYDAIFSDLNLFKPVDPDSEDTEDRALEAQAPQLLPPPPAQGQGRGNRGRGGPVQLPAGVRTLSGALPYQLNGRVAHLFMFLKDGSNNARTFGPQATSPAAKDVVARNRDWLESIDRPSILSLSQFDDARGDIRGLSLIAVPIAGASRDAVLVATVPVRSTAKRFFDEVNASGDNAAFLLDENLTVMAASASDRIGGALDPQISATVSSLAAANAESTTGLQPGRFTIGARTFDPSVVAVHPVKVLDKQWYVVLVTPQADVDGVVGPLFRKALFWAVFVALSMTAILLSTAIQLIRTRVRMERERHELLEKEMRQARDIQLHWLPRPRAKDGVLDIATINQPASRISGDFYNWFELPDGRTAVVIGDVTGHGMAAAFLMATTQLLVRNTLPVTEDPGRCLDEINRQLCTQVFNGQFVTLQILVLDPHTGRVEIATAGHPGPLLGEGESFHPLDLEPNLVLGVDKTSTYPTEQFQLAPRSTLLLYTDGVIDAESARGARFGADRLRQALYGLAGDADAVIQTIVHKIDAFRGPVPLGDDLTMVAIQLQGKYNRPSTHAPVAASVGNKL